MTELPTYPKPVHCGYVLHWVYSEAQERQILRGWCIAYAVVCVMAGAFLVSLAVQAVMR